MPSVQDSFVDLSVNSSIRMSAHFFELLSVHYLLSFLLSQAERMCQTAEWLTLLQARIFIGAGCRFPRFIRIRDDKKLEDASGPEVICDMFNKQTRKVQPAGQSAPAKQQKREAEHLPSERSEVETYSEADPDQDKGADSASENEQDHEGRPDMQL